MVGAWGHVWRSRLMGATCSLCGVLSAACSWCCMCSPLGIYLPRCWAPVCVIQCSSRARARVSMRVCNIPVGQWAMEHLRSMRSCCPFHSGRVFAHVIEHVRSWALVLIVEVALDGTMRSLHGMLSAAGSQRCVCSPSGVCLQCWAPVCAIICLWDT
jgi:hypothetical protein